MTSAAILNAGKNQTRFGNQYGVDGERVTALNPEGAPTPAMEVWRFATYDALVAAQESYPGFVTAIMLGNRHVQPWIGKREPDNGPKDYFVELPDRSFVRSDKWGRPTTVLETLKPDHSGVINAEETGPGGSPPAASDEGDPPIIDITEQLKAGGGQWKVAHIPIGKPGVIVRVRTPTVYDASRPDGYINVGPTNQTPPQTMIVMVNGRVYGDGNDNHIGITINGGGAINLAPDAQYDIHVMPHDLQRNGKGEAAVVVEVALPGRGLAYVW